MTKNPRRRPLLVAKALPPPPTATTVMLQKMLKKKTKKKSSSKMTIHSKSPIDLKQRQHHQKNQQTLQQAPGSEREKPRDGSQAGHWSFLHKPTDTDSKNHKEERSNAGTTPAAPTFAPNSSSLLTRTNGMNVFAAVGGLSNAPTFRKKKVAAAKLPSKRNVGMSQTKKMSNCKPKLTTESKNVQRSTRNTVATDGRLKCNNSCKEGDTSCGSTGKSSSVEFKSHQPVLPTKANLVATESNKSTETTSSTSVEVNGTHQVEDMLLPDEKNVRNIDGPRNDTKEQDALHRIGLYSAKNKAGSTFVGKKHSASASSADRHRHLLVQSYRRPLNIENVVHAQGKNQPPVVQQEQNSIRSTDNTSPENAIKQTTCQVPPKTPLHSTIPQSNNDGIINDDPYTLSSNPPPGSSFNTMKKRPHPSTVNNDNFVRLNLRNSAGSCRGAKNKKRKFSGRGRSRHHINSTLTTDEWKDENELSRDANIHRWQRPNGNDTLEDDVHDKIPDKKKLNQAQYASKTTGLDPLDEFIDGVFHAEETKECTAVKSSRRTAASNANDEVPKCSRHQLPCKMLVVKKASTGNKGRKFYVCCLPRGEQCNHFEWVDNTAQATRDVLSRNSSHSSFIARQLANHIKRFRSLTVPELRKELDKRNLRKMGNKKQLLMRLAVFTRDEIDKGSSNVSSSNNHRTTHQDINGDISRNISLQGSDNVEVQLDADQFNDTDNDSHNESDSGSDSGSDCDSDSSIISLDELELVREGSKDSTTGTLPSDKPEVEEEWSTDETSNGLDDLKSALFTYFGHSKFRDGQEWAIKRCLEQKNSLLVAPTGFGKSLCYALPAALLDGICLVVSPLISLIQDQLRALPPRISAATLSGSISTSEMAAILDDVMRNRIKVLFVSPERLTSPSFRRLFRPQWNSETKTYRRRFPEVSLLCVDEAHCISQWAHNFRPCFLRFQSLVRQVTPKSTLAITATAGPRVIRDIVQTLNIETSHDEGPMVDEINTNGEYGVKVIEKGRDNIDVSCQFVDSAEDRLAMLARILKPKKVGTLRNTGSSSRSRRSNNNRNNNNNDNVHDGALATGAVIVYVWRQRDTEVVAEYLNSADVLGGIVVYHGGMDANARSKSQNKFMRGKARICVATVAFGMGIDKSDVVGVVHMYMSTSLEHYLQEIGRAGRDGRLAKAIALPIRDEVPVRHSLLHSNCISKNQIMALFESIRNVVRSAVDKCHVNQGQDKEERYDVHDHHSVRSLHIGLPVQLTVLKCDCKVETIETLLSIIEQRGGLVEPLIQMEGFNYDCATIVLKKTTLEKLAKKEPVAASIACIATRLDVPRTVNGSSTNNNSNSSSTPSLWEDDPSDTAASTTTTSDNAFFRQRQFLAYSLGTYTFSVSECANRLGPSAEPRHVYAALKRLQSSNELELALGTGTGTSSPSNGSTSTTSGRTFSLKLSAEAVSLLLSAERKDQKQQHRQNQDQNQNENQEQHVDNDKLSNLIDALHQDFYASIVSGSSKVLSMYNILNEVANSSISSSSSLSNKEDDDGDVEEEEQQGQEEQKESINSMMVVGSRKKSSSLICFQNLVNKYFQEQEDITATTSTTSTTLLTIQTMTCSNDTTGTNGNNNNNKKQNTENDIRNESISLFERIRCKEIEIDTLALLRDLPCMINEVMSCPKATIFGGKGSWEYTSMALCKFLHGLDSARASRLHFRTHPLFGKWRRTQFLELFKTIYNFLEPKAKK